MGRAEPEEPDSCEVCRGSFIGSPIPEDQLEHYGGRTHWRNEIAVYDLQLDRTVAFECPHCGNRRPR